MFRFFTRKFVSIFWGNLAYECRRTAETFVEEMRGETFTILYGSQTGQAKAIAEEIYEQSENHGFKPKLFCLSTTEKKFSLEKESLVVFVVSTTGDGEPPDTMGKFWRRLKKKTLSPTYLKGLRYALLGLGDTNYTNFCNCSKMLNSRLNELGASHFYTPGYADDAVGLEVVVEPWIEGLWSALKGALNSDNEADRNKISNLTSALPDKGTSDQTLIVPNGDKTSTVEPAGTGSTKQSKTESVQDNSSHNNGSPNNSNMVQEVIEDCSLGGKTASVTMSVPPLSDCDLSVPILPAPYLVVEFNDQMKLDTSSLCWQDGAEFPGSSSAVTPTKIVSVVQMTRGDAVKTAFAITFDTGDLIFDYNPGDSFGILCPNDEKEVNDLINRLGYNEQANAVFTVEAQESSVMKKRAKGRPDYIPHFCTIRHALTTCVEIRAVPRKAFLRVLCEYTSNPKEKRRLLELCSKQGAGDYSTFIREPNVTFIDILNAFPSCKPPFERLLEHLPRLLPRPYSVSCSPLENPTRLRFVFNIVKFLRIEKVRDERYGLCTGWLKKLAEHFTTEHKNNGETVESNMHQLHLEDPLEVCVVHRNPTGFHLPQDPKRPLIMIGPGTGVAPFLGFLQHRQYLRKQACEDVEFGAAWLFYGCRHKDRDFLFREELTEFEKNGVLTKLLVSFSRDVPIRGPGDAETPKYVQDNIRIWGNDLCDLIYNSGAFIYVCGDAKNMAKNVLETFIEVLQKFKGLELKEAEKEIWQLRQEHRYVEDIWT